MRIIPRCHSCRKYNCLTTCSLLYFPWLLKKYPWSSTLVLTSSGAALRVVEITLGLLGSGSCGFQRPPLLGCFRYVETKKMESPQPACLQNHQCSPQLNKEIPLVCFCLWLTFISKRVLQNMGNSCTEHVPVLSC